MDTRVAYWTQDGHGNLVLFNAANQQLTTVPAAQAKSYVAAYSAGDPRATSVGTSSTGGSTGGSGGGSGGAGMTANQSATNARRAQQDAWERDQAARQEAESARRWKETYDVDKAKFNAQQGLAEAQQKWREAVDSRDFQAAEFWKNRSYEMERNQLTRAATNDLYAAKRGPQDWVSYWYRSRGMTPPAGAESVRIEDAVPSWARPVEYGQGAPRAAAQTAPAWSQPTTQQQSAQPGRQQGQVLDIGATTFGGKGGLTPAWVNASVAPGANIDPKAVLAFDPTQPKVGAISLSDWSVKNLQNAPAWAVPK